MPNLSGKGTLSELVIAGIPTLLPDGSAAELTAFDIDVAIYFDFEAGERGCHTRSNGDPGWPDVPPAIYVNAVMLATTITFTCCDEGDADYMARTYPAGFDITTLLSSKTISGLEDDLLAERESDCDYHGQYRFEPEHEGAY